MKKQKAKSETSELMRQVNQPSQNILSKILAQSQSPLGSGLKRLAVFDLDSTLFDVSPRLQKVLDDFAKDPSHQDLFPETLPFFQLVKTELTDWGVENALKRAGLDKPSLQFQKALGRHWRRTFFSNEYLHYDIPFPGAVDFVHKLHSEGVEIIYLTGRDQHRMGSGSHEVLRKWNFPLSSSGDNLVLKPAQGMDDAKFKRDWFLGLTLSQYEIIWFFENEPVNIDLINSHIPEIDVIFFDSTHSGRSPIPDHLPQIRHFVIEDYRISTSNQEE